MVSEEFITLEGRAQLASKITLLVNWALKRLPMALVAARHKKHAEFDDEYYDIQLQLRSAAKYEELLHNYARPDSITCIE